MAFYYRRGKNQEIRRELTILELNELGYFILNLCQGQMSKNHIIDAVCESYEGDRKEVEVDTLSFLSELDYLGILGSFDDEPKINETRSKDGPWAKLHEEAWSQYFPLFCTIETTLLCNLKCVHCYNFDRSESPKKELYQTLSWDVLEPLLYDLYTAGTLQVSFSGGEALLYPDLERAIRITTDLGMFARVKSNGVLLNENKIDQLIRAGAVGVDISLYGSSSKNHDSFTRKTGSFEASWNNVLLCKEMGLEPEVSVMVTRHNAYEIDEMLDLFKKNNISCQVSMDMTGRYDGTDSSLDDRVTSEQFKRLLRGPHRGLFDVRREVHEVQCACARTNCGISANGDVYPCIGAPIPAGNLKENSFLDIWNHSPVLKNIRALKYQDFSSCFGCKDAEFCERSSGSVYVNTGDYTGADPNLCKEARMRHDYSRGFD